MARSALLAILTSLRMISPTQRSLASILAVVSLGLALAVTPASASGRRVALVIGNGHYQSIDPLPNPRNDAHDIAEKLKGLGFEVILDVDVNKQSFQRDLAQFSRTARDSEAALLYYAGHAMQYGGANYFMPVDAQLQDEYSLASDMVGFDAALAALDAAHGVKVLIVDACRNNPLADRMQSASRGIAPTAGLAKVQASYGTLVAYATQANKVAADGEGRNSPFTAALLDQIGAPGVEIVSTFRRVIEEVYAKTDKKQLPEVSVQLVGEFYLNPAPAPAAALASAPPQTASAAPAVVNAAPDQRLALASRAEPERQTEAATLDPRAFAKAAKIEMTRLGCYAGPIDDDWSSPSVQQALNGLAHFAHPPTPPLFPSIALIEDLRKREGRLCPVICSPAQELKGDACIARTCPHGQTLNERGDCAAPLARWGAQARPAPIRQPIQPRRAAAEAPRDSAKSDGSSYISSRFREQACLLDKRYCK
jgi:uncharacterized caspase-like protein